MFYTTVPVEYMDHIKIAAVPELGVHFEGEKELYYVKVSVGLQILSILVYSIKSYLFCNFCLSAG